jgi:putative redox protein
MAEPETGVVVEQGSESDDGWVTARVGPRGFRVDVRARGHALVADEPVPLGGTDAGATPYEYLLGALSGCMAMTLRMYADRKGWPLEGVQVKLRSGRSHERDCEQCATEKVGITRIERQIELSGPLADEQRQRLLQIAERCPLKQTLERGIRVEAAP